MKRELPAALLFNYYQLFGQTRKVKSQYNLQLYKKLVGSGCVPLFSYCQCSGVGARDCGISSRTKDTSAFKSRLVRDTSAGSTVAAWGAALAITIKTCDGTHPVALQVPHLDLQQGEVSQDLQVVFVPLQRVAVALDGLVVLLVGSLQQPVHVPALCNTTRESRGQRVWTATSGDGTIVHNKTTFETFQLTSVRWSSYWQTKHVNRKWSP